MASVKLATLLIRTVAKPISIRIKRQAAQHERFKQFCVNLAQFMYRTEVKLRTSMLGEPARHIRPLSETKAIENGVNFLAEGFMFSVAASIILGETWRSSRSQSKRRDDVDDKLDELGTQVVELTSRVNEITGQWQVQMQEEKHRNDELARILERVVEIGLRGGWAEFQETPLQFPRISLGPRRLGIESGEPSPSSSDNQAGDEYTPSSSQTPTELDSNSNLKSDPAT